MTMKREHLTFIIINLCVLYLVNLKININNYYKKYFVVNRTYHILFHVDYSNHIIIIFIGFISNHYLLYLNFIIFTHLKNSNRIIRFQNLVHHLLINLV